MNGSLDGTRKGRGMTSTKCTKSRPCASRRARPSCSWIRLATTFRELEIAADIYLMPTYDPMACVNFETGRWVIHYLFPPDPLETHSVVETQALPLSPEIINQVLDSIAEHTVPSI